MGTPELVVAMLFVQDVRQEARNEGKAVAARGVKRLREPACLEAFVAEWTIAKMAWVEQYAPRIKTPALHDALKHRIHETVIADSLAVYQMAAIEKKQGDGPKHDVGTLFLRGFCRRMEKLPRKPTLFGKKDLSPQEQVEIMDAVNHACWSLPGDLETVLEAIRPRVTHEFMELF